MTSTPQNLPAIPRLHIDLDEILGTIALELARVRICGQCGASVPSLINDLAHLVAELTRLSGDLDQTRWTAPTCAPRCAPRSPRTPTARRTRCGTSWMS